MDISEIRFVTFVNVFDPLSKNSMLVNCGHIYNDNFNLNLAYYV